MGLLPSHRADALRVVSMLRESGHVAYFAGGCVRDTLMGREPADWDVATDAPPTRVRALFRNTQAVGASFGVILVKIGASNIEVATFRTDGDYGDGRRPDAVVFSTPEADARRRDFTINGLFMDPLADDAIIDFVGGREDIAAKVIRAIGVPGDRFREDHLRLLRAVRFAARFDFAIEPATGEAIRSAAPLLARISPERIADELRRMLLPPTRGRAWGMLESHGLAAVLWRHVRAIHPALGTGGLLAYGAGESWPLGAAMAAAVLPAGEADVAAACERATVKRIAAAVRGTLKWSNEEEADFVASLEGVGVVLAAAGRLTVAALKRLLAKPQSPIVAELLGAMSRAGRFVAASEAFASAASALEGQDVAPVPLVTGDHLVAAGYSPGPRFKGVLDAVYDAQLEGRVATHEAGMKIALELLGAG